MFQRGFDGPTFSLGSSWGARLVTEGSILVERGGLWGMAVMHSLFPSPWAISSEDTVWERVPTLERQGRKNPQVRSRNLLCGESDRSLPVIIIDYKSGQR